ncbi:MAG: hypothetical protein ACKOWF_01565, partial [Chloroflexota bacterium]
AAAALVLGGVATEQAAEARGQSGRNRKKKARRPERRPVTPNPGTNPPVITVPQPTLSAGYTLGQFGTLSITGSHFRPNEPVTITIKMDWIASLGVYLVSFTATVTTDAFGGFTWNGDGYCPRVIDVWADQGDTHLHQRVEDSTCPW